MPETPAEMPHNSDIQLDQEASELLSNWRSERAYRVLFAVSRISPILSLAAIAADYFYDLPWIVTVGAVVLGLGSLISYYLTPKEGKAHWLAWGPLYFGAWFATSSNLWVTGGLHSPFLGTFLAVLCLGGLVIQNQLRPIFVMSFIFFNLALWTAVDVFKLSPLNIQTPHDFNFFIHAIVLSAIMVCIFEFFRTEKNLAREIIHRYRELSRAKEELSREEAASSAKSTFLANVSHELRTPLGAIVGYAELLLDSETEEDDKTLFAETILRNGQTLSRLVNDLLDLSKVEAGKIEVVKSKASPEDLIHEVVQTFAISAHNKGLEIRVSAMTSIPRTFETDPLRFKQIVSNLLNNAIKFTERGFIDVRISQTNGRLGIEVTDSGPGLSPEEKSRLFKRFSQANSKVSQQYGGTGLGLNLSRSLAHLLGGDLVLAWSEKGVGTSFLFTHPSPALGTELSI